MLKDRSAGGARLMIAGPPPRVGSSFDFALANDLLSGTVKWVQVDGDIALFGVETRVVRVS